PRCRSSPLRAACLRWRVAARRFSRRCAVPASPCPLPAGQAISTSSASLTPAQLRLLDQAFVLVRDQVSLDLRDRIERYTDDDQKRSATKVERYPSCGDQVFGQQTDGDEVDGADDRDAGEHVVDVVGRALARAIAGNEAGMLLELVGSLLRIEHDGR